MQSAALPNPTAGNAIAVPLRFRFGSLRALLRRKSNTESGGAMPHPGVAGEDEYLNRARLIAAACHDMRQPLQALSLFSESLSSIAATPPQHVLSHKIGQSVGILNDMFDQMLTMLQLDASAYRPDIIRFSIGEVLTQVENDFESQVHGKGLGFKIERCSALVRSDTVLLYRAISNLVSNAVSYTQSGQITVRCHELPGKLRIEIADTGTGIALGDIPHIFDDFYRVDGQSGSHLGLGLANVRRIASLLGMRVDVRSELGIGSTFMIEIALPSD
ncbi:MAG TPA: HAMP domain-containing sensor histidine kinase [Gallionella sp.]|nr:HAMP domain-containing sensor histidine kinase [Gallionella sp.]